MLTFLIHNLSLITAAMNSPSIMDNTTVVGGTHSTMGDNDFHVDPSSSTKGLKPHPTIPSSKNLRDTADYLETERPFFVKIGKDGLISALQKLDRQLQQVNALSFCTLVKAP